MECSVGKGAPWGMVLVANPDSPKASPMAIFKRKNLIEQLNLLLEWMLNEKAEYAEFNLPTCGNIAVWQLCTERQPLCGRVMMAWISHYFGSMPWCSFPWHKLLPGLTLAQKNCCTVYSLNLIHDHEFTSTYIYIRVFNLPALCRFA